jgi:hypothetical protein
MFRKNRGQGAMEYLMTYGWAILVVMIVGIVMWQLGIFNLNQGSTTTTGFSKIKPQLAGVNKRGETITVVFTNGAGTTIDLGTVSARKNGAVNDASSVPATLSFPAGGTTTALPAGTNFMAVARGTGGTSQRPAAVGNTFDVRIDITYSLNIGGITTTHRDSGTLRGPVT